MSAKKVLEGKLRNRGLSHFSTRVVTMVGRQRAADTERHCQTLLDLLEVVETLCEERVIDRLTENQAA